MSLYLLQKNIIFLKTKNVKFLIHLHKTLLSTNRGVGCIFLEMIKGSPIFPGQSDATDQLFSIFDVRKSLNIPRVFF